MIIDGLIVPDASIEAAIIEATKDICGDIMQAFPAWQVDLWFKDDAIWVSTVRGDNLGAVYYFNPESSPAKIKRIMKKKLAAFY